MAIHCGAQQPAPAKREEGPQAQSNASPTWRVAASHLLPEALTGVSPAAPCRLQWHAAGTRLPSLPLLLLLWPPLLLLLLLYRSRRRRCVDLLALQHLHTHISDCTSRLLKLSGGLLDNARLFTSALLWVNQGLGMVPVGLGPTTAPGLTAEQPSAHNERRALKEGCAL